MKNTTLTPQELNTVATAEEVAARYDYISKWDFLVEVKMILGNFNSVGGIKTAVNVWNKYFGD